MSDQTLPGLDSFAGQLHGQFNVRLGDGSVYPLTLIEAALLPRHAGTPTDRAQSFHLVFHGPGPGYLPQQMHLLNNSALGEHAIFLVPVGQDAEGFLYQAVFN